MAAGNSNRILKREIRLDLAYKCFDFLPLRRNSTYGLGGRRYFRALIMKFGGKAKAACRRAADIDNALQVLRTEIEGFQKLAQSLDGNFTRAVEAIDKMKTGAAYPGRLIVAGIGKSGHVARKIAATMASTGTPAYYVHPSEASHGDLDMITENDIVLMLSNSSEDTELSDLIHYAKRYGIVLIAITADPDSALGKHADIRLILPNVPEACPNGLAPTTSTSMMLALGDALAVALLHRMGLTPEAISRLSSGRQTRPEADGSIRPDDAASERHALGRDEKSHMGRSADCFDGKKSRRGGGG